MRLLQRLRHTERRFGTTSYRISLTKDLHENVPTYAILSHTWGDEEQELKFDDIEPSRVNKKGDRQRSDAIWNKSGVKKILFCSKQAEKAGIEYVWVDTCCINQSSQTELGEAINSMFRWYHDAKKCYVYLSDVLAKDRDRSTWESSFRRCRWFTRGWTLQELLAPDCVEFYSADKVYLGDKQTLEVLIHEITCIPLKALRGDWAGFSIEERMKWVEKRITKRPEDIAYCMFGILGIFMPPLYGEGKVSAMARLRRELALQSEINRPLGSSSGKISNATPSAVPEDVQADLPFSLWDRSIMIYEATIRIFWAVWHFPGLLDEKYRKRIIPELFFSIVFAYVLSSLSETLYTLMLPFWSLFCLWSTVRMWYKCPSFRLHISDVLFRCVFHKQPPTPLVFLNLMSWFYDDGFEDWFHQQIYWEDEGIGIFVYVLCMITYSSTAGEISHGPWYYVFLSGSCSVALAKAIEMLESRVLMAQV